jgi:hypothetical protein
LRLFCFFVPWTQGPIDTEHEDTNSTKEDMEGVDGDIHDRFEKLEFDDARRKCRLSITNKDKGGSDDQQRGRRELMRIVHALGPLLVSCITNGCLPAEDPRPCESQDD